MQFENLAAGCPKGGASLGPGNALAAFLEALWEAAKMEAGQKGGAGHPTRGFTDTNRSWSHETLGSGED